VVHLIADRLVDRSGEIARLSDGSLDHDAAFAGGLALIESSDDARAAPARDDRYRHRHPRDVRVLPKSRDFH
jgi:error-prone DNA polymerase